MFKIFSKFIKNKSDEKSENNDKNKDKNIAIVGSEIKKSFNDFVAELFQMKEKLHNLEETNINLGKYHLSNDNLSDAIFRFKFASFFWPKSIEAKYYLAYCYFLKKRFEKSKAILLKLLEDNPYHEESNKLLNKINEHI